MNSVIPSNISELIRAISVYSLPTRPSDKGYSPDQIKKAMYQPSVELATYLLSLDNYMNKMNGIPKVYPSMPTSDLANFEDGTLLFVAGEDLTAYVVDDGVATKIGYSFSEFVSRVTALEGYFTDGKANKAIGDEDGTNIKSTYAKDNEVVHLSGAENITGAKTFNGNVALGASGSDNSKTLNVYYTTNLRGPVTSSPILPGNAGFSLGSSSSRWNTAYIQSLDLTSANITFGTYTITIPSETGTLANQAYVATAKAEAISSAATTAQSKVDALASAMDFSNGAFGTIVAALLKVTKMEVTDTETKTATLEDQFLEMLAGNTVAYGTNYVGFVFTKYDASNDFFVGIYNDTLMIGDCTATRSNGKITNITPISLEPLATRAATNALTDSHLLKWDGVNLRLIDAGVSDTDVSSVLLQESSRVSAESARVLAENARVTAEANRALQEKYRVINHPYAITQAEYNTLMNGGVFGVHLSTPLVEGDEPQLICTVYASEALAEAAEETYIFPIQDNVEYPAKGISGDSPYLNIPAPPQADGNYVLKCSVVNGAVTYTWEAEN